MHSLDFLEPYASAPYAARAEPRKNLRRCPRYDGATPFSLRLALKGNAATQFGVDVDGDPRPPFCADGKNPVAAGRTTRKVHDYPLCSPP